MAAAKKNEEVIEIRPMDRKKIKIRIVGETPLIVHAWSSKAKRMMLEAQMGTSKGKKKPIRNPFDDFAQACYWLSEKPDNEEGIITEEAFNKAVKAGAKFGFPVTGIKQGANSAAYRQGWVKNQMGLRGAYFLEGMDGDTEIAQIHYKEMVMREDLVRVGMGSADLRYRPEFRDWYMDVMLEYNASGEISLENILNCINAGGYVCGLGEQRPEKDGNNGRYHVEVPND